MAKTWEMKNDKGLSLERYASASGLQFIYSRHSGKSVEFLNANKIFAPQIAALAIEGDKQAIETFQEIAEYLAWLMFERLSTLFGGSLDIFNFVNPKRQRLDRVHLHRGEILDRIVIGQRLGDFMSSPDGEKVLTAPLLARLGRLIHSADSFPDRIKDQYIKGKQFRHEKIVFSRLREAPALGAGIDAHLAYLKKL
jgi:predicted NBD/HSP70 family sugar kinase